MLKQPTKIVNLYQINVPQIIYTVLIFDNANFMIHNYNVKVYYFFNLSDNIASSGAKSCKWVDSKCVDK